MVTTPPSFETGFDEESFTLAVRTILLPNFKMESGQIEVGEIEIDVAVLLVH